MRLFDEADERANGDAGLAFGGVGFVAVEPEVILLWVLRTSVCRRLFRR